MNDKIDPKYIGVPNICFSLTDKNDFREPEFIKQRLEQGFDDSETWYLRDTFASFILPRLKRYREIIEDVIQDHDNLYADVDAAIFAFEFIIRIDKPGELSKITKKDWKKYNKGMKAFGKVYMALWW